MFNLIHWGNTKIIETKVENYSDVCSRILNEFHLNQSKIEKSHKIGGRWENQYLEIEYVPSARTPMRIARDLGKDKLDITSIALFEPLRGVANPYPPFWFNIASNGEKTGLHDHAHLSILSAVLYLQVDAQSGDLFFQKENFSNLRIRPEVGKLVIFPPHLKHGVEINQSSKERISFAFNLFPFPIPSTEW